MIKVKLCGFTEEKSLLSAIDCGVDFIGFVFHAGSVRNISFENAKMLSKLVPASVGKVAVVVDPNLDLLENIASSLQPQYFQIHGLNDKNRLLQIKEKFPKIKIIKAFGVKQKIDLEQIVDFIDLSDIILLDNVVSGSGKSFDFKILENFSCKKNWFLSGGLNINNIDEALKITGATMIDISSGIEEVRGKKSTTLIQNFMRKVKNVC